VLKVRKLSGLRQTRKSITEDFGMLRHDGQHAEIDISKPR
jgi:hypothetical protein